MAFVPVKFCKVDEAFTKRLANVPRADEVTAPEVKVPRFAVVPKSVDAKRFVDVA